MPPFLNRRLPRKYIILIAMPWVTQLLTMYFLLSLAVFLSEHSVDYFITIPGLTTMLLLLYLAILVPEIILIFALNMLNENGFKVHARVLAVVRPSLVAAALLIMCGPQLLLWGLTCIVITFVNMRMIGKTLGWLNQRHALEPLKRYLG